MKNKFLDSLDLILTSRWVDISLLALAYLAWGATILRLVRGSTGLSQIAEIGIFILGAVTLLSISTLSIKYRTPSLDPHKFLTKLPSATLFIFLGVSLRITWVFLFPAAPASDGATYLSLAHQLINGVGYQTDGTVSYWPPGYPLFLTAWIFLLPDYIAIPLSQISLFVIGASGIYTLTKHISNDKSAAIATALFAIWPNLIALCSTPEKEAVILALLPWLTRWLLDGSLKSVILAGIALGACVLVQPSLQLLIPAFAILQIIRNGFSYFPLALLFLTATLLVIAPWSLRNIEMLGEFKLVSTNGGSVLYRANNPLATGGYTDKGEFDLSHLSELEADKKGRELAIAWIKENPGSFLILAIEKQIRFMGDDASGVYGTFRSAGNKRDNSLYVPLKLMANGWWLFIWFLLARSIQNGHKLQKNTRILVWGWFYLYILHSVFESSGKYHAPMLWVLCITLGILLQASNQKLDVCET